VIIQVMAEITKTFHLAPPRFKWKFPGGALALAVIAVSPHADLSHFVLTRDS
jgi:hypothetical protein